MCNLFDMTCPLSVLNAFGTNAKAILPPLISIASVLKERKNVNGSPKQPQHCNTGVTGQSP